jgi:hypothetical protein
MDWASASILISVAGAGASLLDARLFALGALLFVVGLIIGINALRKGIRRNRAVIGIVLNAANLVFDVALVIVR